MFCVSPFLLGGSSNATFGNCVSRFGPAVVGFRAAGIRLRLALACGRLLLQYLRLQHLRLRHLRLRHLRLQHLRLQHLRLLDALLLVVLHELRLLFDGLDCNPVLPRHG